MATSDTSGRSSPSRSRLMPTMHVESCLARSSRSSSTRRSVSTSECRYSTLMPRSGQVVGQILGHLLGQCGHQHALVFARRASLISAEQVVDLPLGRACTTILRVDQAGRSDDLLDHAVRAARARSRRASPTGRRSARRASEELRPISAGGCPSRTAGGTHSSTSVRLRDASPSYIAPICGTVTCDSSMISRKSSGK